MVIVPKGNQPPPARNFFSWTIVTARRKMEKQEMLEMPVNWPWRTTR
jgi:hypothetical protein